jgi:hypothetical protein
MSTTSMEDLITQRLPHDALANVLCRLEPTPRLLAASRCVCETWRDAIDAHGLLRADLLPLSVSGIFTHPADETLPDYFPLPRQLPSLEIPAAAFDRLDTDRGIDPLMVVNHCNGLLLLDKSSRVLNPATGQWASLPSPPHFRLMGTDDFYGYEEDPDYEYEDGFLVFDPAVSPHYQVLLINSIPFIPWPDSDQMIALNNGTRVE